MCREMQKLIKIKVGNTVRRNHMVAVQKSNHLPVLKQGNYCGLTVDFANGIHRGFSEVCFADDHCFGMITPSQSK